MNDTVIPELPTLSDADIDRIERELFAQIAAEEGRRPVAARPARSRRRGWLTAGGVAAAFVAGILVTPPILDAVTPGFLTGVRTASSADSGGAMPEMAPPFTAGGDGALLPATQDGGTPEREIIASAHATVRVAEVPAASDAITALALAHGGYVESTSIGMQRDYDAYSSSDAAMPMPVGGDYGWITIRVPSDSLTAVLAGLSDVGTVTDSSLSQQDVTSVAIDLRARVTATRASVERLTELMSQTGSVSELIEAEVALSERQAQLESFEQQLATLDEQISLSSVSVSLERIRPVTTPEPAGFGDGLAAGWDGMIVSLNALVIAAGFLLPWLALVGVIVLVLWMLRRRARAQRLRSAGRGAPDPD